MIILLFISVAKQEAMLSEEDNRLDETHKPTHFLDVAEAYLRLSKAEYSNVWIAEQYYGSKKHENRIRQLLKIATIPQIAKDIIRGKNSQRVLKILRIEDKKSFASDSQNFANYFKEGYFQDITKLRYCDQIKIVAEIALSKGNLKGQKLKDECNKLKYQEELKRLVLEKLYEKKLKILREIFRDIEHGQITKDQFVDCSERVISNYPSITKNEESFGRPIEKDYYLSGFRLYLCRWETLAFAKRQPVADLF